MIENYQFGHIRIDGVVYDKDLILTNNEVYPNWWRKESHNLFPEDFINLDLKKVTLVIIGTGTPGLMSVDSSTIKMLDDLHVQYHIAPTPQAVELWNQHLNENAIALLHLTC